MLVYLQKQTLMKTLRVNAIATLFFMMVGWTTTFGQNQPEVPGDQFSLEGALELFKKSASPEEFERLLNSPREKVNNLDLNGDGEIDYIRVIDRNEGNVHAFILSAIISESESQDIAVIELEKLANGKAVLQITGDEDIYGIETIIEPSQEVRVNAGTSTARTVVNVWAWPSVQYVYSPYYAGWISPWRWSYRPIWWSPWRPIAYVDYYPYWVSYRPYYSVCHIHRIVYAQNIYRPYRNTSVVVYNRHHAQVAHYRSTRGDDYERGRDRYDDGRSRQNNNASRNDNNGRGRAYDSREKNRSSANDWQRTGHTENKRSSNDWRSSEDSRRSSSVTRDESVLRNRTNPEVKRGSSVSHQNTREVQRQDTRERSNPAPVVRQREVRPTPDTRSTQRPAPQIERKQTSSPNVQRSGNSGGGSKPIVKKRGRD